VLGAIAVHMHKTSDLLVALAQADLLIKCVAGTGFV
jgi:hypothetical protein